MRRFLNTCAKIPHFGMTGEGSGAIPLNKYEKPHFRNEERAGADIIVCPRNV